MNSNQPSFPSITIQLVFKPILVCCTFIFILTIGEPDLLDAIIKLVLSFAK